MASLPDEHAVSRSLDIAAIRDQFPIVRERAYLNNASIGPLSNPVVDATQAFLHDVRDHGRNNYPNWCRHADESVKARLGVVGILGNHDVSEEVPALERLGVRMLINEALEVRRGRESAWVIGVDDPHYYGCDDLPTALRAVPSDAFKILLVHTPELIQEAAAAGVDLYLCGHTHGGQVCLPVIGPLLINANCSRAYARGVWQYHTLQGYTNPGVGTSGVPVRFWCPPEIGLVELRCARHSALASALGHHGPSAAQRPAPGSVPRAAGVS